MARYKLMIKSFEGGEETIEESTAHRKNTKADCEQWITDNVKACGLDWRVGYLLKLRGDDSTYEFVHIKDGSKIKCKR